MLKDIKKIHLRGAFRPILRSTIPEMDRKKVLESHLLLEKKQRGEIKERLVVGGNKQILYVSKKDSGSPTYITESLMLIETIDTVDNRDVETLDIPNEFVKMKVQDTIYMCM